MLRDMAEEERLVVLRDDEHDDLEETAGILDGLTSEDPDAKGQEAIPLQDKAEDLGDPGTREKNVDEE